jgi:hypothetical protein
MAERGKDEESKRTEPAATDPEAEFTVRGNDDIVRAAMSHLAMLHSVMGTGGQGKTAAVVRAAASEEWESLFEDMSAVQMDDAYYDEVRRAVGSGAPSVLFGTSTKSLKRNFQKLRTIRRADIDRPSSPARSKHEQASAQRAKVSAQQAFIAAALYASAAERQAQQSKKD